MTEANLLYGAGAIAAHLGMTATQVYHLHKIGNLPTFKIGAKVCAHKARLDQWLEQQAGGEK